MIDRIRQWSESRQGRQVIKIILRILLAIVIALFIAGCIFVVYDAYFRSKPHSGSTEDAGWTTPAPYVPFDPVEDE